MEPLMITKDFFDDFKKRYANKTFTPSEPTVYTKELIIHMNSCDPLWHNCITYDSKLYSLQGTENKFIMLFLNNY